MNLKERIELGQLRNKLKNSFANITLSWPNITFQSILNIETLNGIIIMDSFYSANWVGQNIWNIILTIKEDKTSYKIEEIKFFNKYKL